MEAQHILADNKDLLDRIGKLRSALRQVAEHLGRGYMVAADATDEEHLGVVEEVKNYLDDLHSELNGKTEDECE